MICTTMVKDVSRDLVRACHILSIFEQDGYALFDVKSCLEMWEHNTNGLKDWIMLYANELLGYLKEADKLGCDLLFLRGQ